MGTAGSRLRRALNEFSEKIGQKIGLQARLFVAFTLVAGFTVGALFLLVSAHLATHLQQRAESSLNQMANVQERRVNRELDRLHKELQLLASRTQMRISLDLYNQTGAQEHLDLLEKILADAMAPIETLRALWIRNPAGEVIAGQQRLPATDVIVPEFLSSQTPIQLVWNEKQIPELWLGTLLYRDDQQIGTLLVHVSLDDVLHIVSDFPSADVIGRSILLLRRNNHELFAVCDRMLPGTTLLGTSSETVTGSWLSQECRNHPAILNPQVPLQVDQYLLLRRPLDYGLGELWIEVSVLDSRRLLLPPTSALILEILAVIIVSLLLAWVFTRMIGRPIGALTAAARRISHGDTQVQVAERGWGQLAELARGFNHAVRAISRRNAALENEIRARRRAQHQLINLANTDTLTGLINRRHFMTLLKRQLTAAQEAGFRDAGALLYLDLDGFKPVNDTIGHEAGDAVLCLVAERLQHLVREQDQVARLGGDEFVVLLHPEPVNGSTEAIAHRIEETLSRPMMIKGQTVQVGCSIGIHELSPNEEPLTALNSADQKMYAAKTAKRQPRRVVGS